MDDARDRPLRALEVGPLAGGPIFNDIHAGRPQQRKKDFEAPSCRCVEVARVIDYDVECLSDVLLHDLAERIGVHLIRPPEAKEVVLRSTLLHISLEQLSSLRRHAEVDADDTTA